MQTIPKSGWIRPVGRPRAVVKLPRKRFFTAADVIDINACSALTVRANIKSLLNLRQLYVFCTTKNKAGQRGRPSFIYTRTA